MNVCAVSPRTKATHKEILAFLAHQKATLVLLPGAAHNTPTPKSVQKVLPAGVSVFVETGRGKFEGVPTLVSRTSIKRMPSQIFAQKPTAEQMRELASVIKKRTFVIGDRKVTFVICGEIIGFNLDGTVKKVGRIEIADVIANPAHTTMGRWHILDRRLKRLSKSGAAIHAANNELKTKSSKTDVRIYRRGKQVGDRQTNGSIAWCEATL